MTSDEQFWWNWWVQLGSAVATLLAVVTALVIAIFGDLLRYKLVPPQLRLRLRTTKIEEIPGTTLQALNDPRAPPHVTSSRWFHVSVTNPRRWIAATDVQVFLLRVEEPDAAGQFTALWTGAVPLKWRHMQSINPAATRVVGQDAEADLVAFFKDAATSKGPFLQLQVMTFPNRLNPQRIDKCTLRLVLQARAREVESNQLAVELAWDGKWPEKYEDASRSMVIREVASSDGFPSPAIASIVSKLMR